MLIDELKHYVPNLTILDVRTGAREVPDLQHVVDPYNVTAAIPADER